MRVRVPSWIGWTLTLAVLHFGLFLCVGLSGDLGLKSGRGDFLVPGLDPLVRAVEPHLRGGDRPIMNRSMWPAIVVIVCYFLAVATALYWTARGAIRIMRCTHGAAAEPVGKVEA